MKETAADLWLNSMGRYPLLPKAEQLRLSRIIQAGFLGIENKKRQYTPAAKRAINKMVAHNLRLVVNTWQRTYQWSMGVSHPNLTDLLQEGAVGLRDAAMRFDPSRGYSFGTYAPWWIRKGFTDYFRNQRRTIRVPAYVASAVEKVNDAKARCDYSGRVPDWELERLAAQVRVKPEVLLAYVDAYRVTDCVTGDRAVGNGKPSSVKEKSSTLLEMIAYEPDQPVEPERLRKWRGRFDLVASRAQLDPFERDLVFALAEGSSYSNLPQLFPQVKNARRHAINAMSRFKAAAVTLAEEVPSLCEA